MVTMILPLRTGPAPASGSSGALREAEPEDVDGHAEVLDRHPGPLAHGGVAAVRCRRPGRPAPPDGPAGVCRPHADDAAALFDQVGDLRAHPQVEGRIALRPARRGNSGSPIAASAR